VATQLAFEEFRPAKLQIPLYRPKFAEGFPFEFELGRRMVQKLASFAKVYGDPTTHTSTPKFVEEVV
jgi:hypothetical protein